MIYISKYEAFLKILLLYLVEYTLVNVYVDLLIFTRIDGTS